MRRRGTRLLTEASRGVRQCPSQRPHPPFARPRPPPRRPLRRVPGRGAPPVADVPREGTPWRARTPSDDGGPSPLQPGRGAAGRPGESAPAARAPGRTTPDLRRGPAPPALSVDARRVEEGAEEGGGGHPKDRGFIYDWFDGFWPVQVQVRPALGPDPGHGTGHPPRRFPNGGAVPPFGSPQGRFAPPFVSGRARASHRLAWGRAPAQGGPRALVPSRPARGARRPPRPAGTGRGARGASSDHGGPRTRARRGRRSLSRGATVGALGRMDGRVGTAVPALAPPAAPRRRSAGSRGSPSPVRPRVPPPKGADAGPGAREPPSATARRRGATGRGDRPTRAYTGHGAPSPLPAWLAGSAVYAPFPAMQDQRGPRTAFQEGGPRPTNAPRAFRPRGSTRGVAHQGHAHPLHARGGAPGPQGP